MLFKKALRLLCTPIIGAIQLTSIYATTKTIAVLPFVFKHSEPEPIKKVEETVQKVFEKAGLNQLSNKTTLDIWTEELKFQKPESLPKNKRLIKLGETLNVDYVCTGTVSWEIKTPWVFLGPKTKAICKVNCIIIDVAKKKVVLNAKDIESDSNKKESGWEIAGDVLLTPLFTMVSGGPKVPHMNRSGQLAIVDALKSFITDLKLSHSKEKGN